MKTHEDSEIKLLIRTLAMELALSFTRDQEINEHATNDKKDVTHSKKDRVVCDANCMEQDGANCFWCCCALYSDWSEAVESFSITTVLAILQLQITGLRILIQSF